MPCRGLVSLCAALSVLLAACGNVSGQVVKKLSSSRSSVQALEPDRFYAKRTVQNLAPDAFALMPAGLETVRAIKQTSRWPRSRLVAALRSDSAVASGITRFPSLDWTTKVAVIRQAVAIEAAVLDSPCRLSPLTIVQADAPHTLISIQRNLAPAACCFTQTCSSRKPTPMLPCCWRYTKFAIVASFSWPLGRRQRISSKERCKRALLPPSRHKRRLGINLDFVIFVHC